MKGRIRNNNDYAYLWLVQNATEHIPGESLYPYIVISFKIRGLSAGLWVQHDSL